MVEKMIQQVEDQLWQVQSNLSAGRSTCSQITCRYYTNSVNLFPNRGFGPLFTTFFTLTFFSLAAILFPL